MRRAVRLLFATVLTAVVLLPASTVAAAPLTVAAGPDLVLAVEEGPPQGPEPRSPDDEENEFAPANYEANFLWGAGIGLLGVVLLIGGAGGAFYYFRVLRPTQPQQRR